MNVAVLISTYNGETYIKEQIESLLKQSYKDIKIYIRDDGSSDNTLEILKKIKENNSNIKVIKGQNLGYCESFLELLKVCDESDYYAFCDQDDIWEEDKIKKAVESLDNYKEEYSLYYSEVKIVDQDLKFISKSNYTGIDTLGASFNTTPVAGCTCVINNKLRKFILDNGLPKDCFSHELFIYRLCLALDGKIVHDHDSYILYRQHEKNTIGSPDSLANKMKTYEKFKNTRNIMAKDMLKLYENFISEKNKKILLQIADFYNKPVIIKKIKLLFNKTFNCKKFKSNIKFVYDVIFNKI